MFNYIFSIKKYRSIRKTLVSEMSSFTFPLLLSLKIAGISTVFSLVAGLWLAWLLANRPFPGRELLDAVVTLPLIFPPTVMGYYLLVLLSRNSPLGHIYESIFGVPLVFTWPAAVVAATIHAIPLLVKSARAGFEQTDPVFERAARSLGANEWRIFWRVTLPLARRTVVAAGVIAFARSLGDFGATLMIAGDIPFRTQTAAIAIYDAVESNHTRLAAALTLVLSGVTLAIAYTANRIEHRRAR
jgi:molybdate transport system permease protein